MPWSVYKRITNRENKGCKVCIIIIHVWPLGLPFLSRVSLTRPVLLGYSNWTSFFLLVCKPTLTESTQRQSTNLNNNIIIIIVIDVIVFSGNRYVACAVHALAKIEAVYHVKLKFTWKTAEPHNQLLLKVKAPWEKSTTWNSVTSSKVD